MALPGYGYEGVSGQVTWGPNGWQYTAPKKTFEEQSDIRRETGLADVYRQYAERLPASERQYYQQYAGDIAGRKLEDLQEGYSRALTQGMGALTSRGLHGSATGELAGGLEKKRLEAETGIGVEAQQLAGQLAEQSRQRYGGLASYYDQLRNQRTQNLVAMQQQALDPAMFGTSRMQRAQEIYQGALPEEKPGFAEDLLTNVGGQLGNIAGSYLGNMTSGGGSGGAPAGAADYDVGGAAGGNWQFY
jgi:hypothetical protein